MIRTTIILSLLSFVLFKADAQKTPEKFNFKTTGEIKCKLIYNQYYDSLVIDDNDVFTDKFELYAHDYQDTQNLSMNYMKYFFKFQKRRRFPEKICDVLYLENDSCILKYNVPEDSLLTHYNKQKNLIRSYLQINHPILKTDKRKKLIHIETNDWIMIHNYIESICMDTDLTNLTIKNKSGIVEFQNLNNLMIFEVNRYDNPYLLITSLRSCRNQILIFKVYI